MKTPTNREEWLEVRKKGIGASEASCIIGANPWKTNQQLFDEKIGIAEAEDISDKPCVAYGKSAEEFVREIFKLDYPQYSVGYSEFEMIANKNEHPWLFATLDGYIVEKDTNRLGVLEIKTTEILNPTQWDKWEDKVPDYYYCQLLHQLLATEYDFAVLRADIRYHKNDELRHTVRDYFFDKNDNTVKNDMDYLLKEEIKFWNCIQQNKRPPQILPTI